MATYIDRDEFVSRINKCVELTNPEEQEWVKDECIRQAHAMPSVNVTEWIRVDERLPERWKYVIVCDECKDVGVARHLGNGHFEWTDDENIAFATHWMPLPEPPKGD